MLKLLSAIVGLLVIGSLPLSAAPSAKVISTTQTRIVQATRDTVLTYGGVEIFVPRGQTIILGTQSNGAVVVRGHQLLGVRMAGITLVSPSAASVSLNSKLHAITINYGNVQVTDKRGNTTTLSNGMSASIKNLNVRIKANKPVSQTSPETALFANDLWSTDVSNIAYQQVVQDLRETELREEDTLSPSTPN